MALDPHSFFADPDPAIFFNADPDPALKSLSQLTLWRVFVVVKNIKECSKVKKQWTLCKFTLKNWRSLQFLPISLHFFFFYLKIFPPGSRSGSAYFQEEKWMRIRINSPNTSISKVHEDTAWWPGTTYLDLAEDGGPQWPLPAAGGEDQLQRPRGRHGQPPTNQIHLLLTRDGQLWS